MRQGGGALGPLVIRINESWGEHPKIGGAEGAKGVGRLRPPAFRISENAEEAKEVKASSNPISLSRRGMTAQRSVAFKVDVSHS